MWTIDEKGENCFSANEYDDTSRMSIDCVKQERQSSDDDYPRFVPIPDFDRIILSRLQKKRRSEMVGNTCYPAFSTTQAVEHRQTIIAGKHDHHYDVETSNAERSPVPPAVTAS